jgi:hypothetical protein
MTGHLGDREKEEPDTQEAITAWHSGSNNSLAFREQ